MIELPSFELICYRFDLEAVSPLHLPAYKGSTLRGGFGYAFKKMVCKRRNWRACNPCQGGNSCPYGYIFESTLPKDSEVLQNLREIPIPFILEPPLAPKRDYEAGEFLSFDLILVGKAIPYLPYFLLAFQELGRMGIGNPAGNYVLKRIQAIHPWRRTSELVFDGVDVRVGGRDLSIRNEDIQDRAGTFNGNQINVRYLTPTRIKHENEISTKPEFHILVRGLVRRLSSLFYFHCGKRWEADFKGIVSQAQAIELTDDRTRWVDWERFSGRQQKRINLGGIVGEVVYRGQVEPFFDLLALGELLHVGKATVFGNGKYVVEE